MFSSLHRFLFGASADEEAAEAAGSATERVRRVERELESVEELLAEFKRLRQDSVKHTLEMREHVEGLTMELEDRDAGGSAGEMPCEVMNDTLPPLRFPPVLGSSPLQRAAPREQWAEEWPPGEKRPPQESGDSGVSHTAASHLAALWESLRGEERRILCQRDLLDVKQAKVEVQAQYLRAQLRTAREALHQAAHTFGVESIPSSHETHPALGLGGQSGGGGGGGLCFRNFTSVEMLETASTTEIVLLPTSPQNDKSTGEFREY